MSPGDKVSHSKSGALGVIKTVRNSGLNTVYLADEYWNKIYQRTNGAKIPLLSISRNWNLLNNQLRLFI